MTIDPESEVIDVLKRQWIFTWQEARAAVRDGQDADAHHYLDEWFTLDRLLESKLGPLKYPEWTDKITAWGFLCCDVGGETYFAV